MYTCSFLPAYTAVQTSQAKDLGDSGDGVTSGVCVGGGSVDRRFTSLADAVSDKTLKAIQEMGFAEMMEIQYRSIRPLLEGK